MARYILWVLLTVPFQAEFVLCRDLKSIFHVPSRRNYDDLEILERSNFGEDAATSPSTSSATPEVTAPKSTANAQVMLRFGDFEGRCRCGDACTCRNRPYYVPVPTPLPCYGPPLSYCLHPPIKPCYVIPHPLTPPQTPPINTLAVSPQRLVAPPCHPHPLPFPTGLPLQLHQTPLYPPCAPIQYNVNSPIQPVIQPIQKPEFPWGVNAVQTTQNENFVNEKVTGSDIKNSNHPVVLDTVELPESSISFPSTEDQIKLPSSIKLFNLLIPNPSEVSPPVLKKCIVPCNYPKLPKPECPISGLPIKSPAVITSESGWAVSGASGFYSDPLKTVVYQKPTELTVVPEQITIIRGGQVKKFVEVPVVGPECVPHFPKEDLQSCNCKKIEPTLPKKDPVTCSCQKYIGELSEFEKA